MTERLRAEAMGRRLARTAGRLGIDDEGRRRLLDAYAVGMEPRFRRGFPDHHPDYLHPARTALILMDDARVADPVTLAAALLLETRDPDLRPDPAAVETLDAAVAALLARVPAPHGDPDRLVETLVVETTAVRMLALAERLDHARHLHLRDRSEWAPYHALTCGAYAPVARRTHPALAGRIDWWCATFEERYLGL